MTEALKIRITSDGTRFGTWITGLDGEPLDVDPVAVQWTIPLATADNAPPTVECRLWVRSGPSSSVEVTPAIAQLGDYEAFQEQRRKAND